MLDRFTGMDRKFVGTREHSIVTVSKADVSQYGSSVLMLIFQESFNVKQLFSDLFFCFWSAVLSSSVLLCVFLVLVGIFHTHEQKCVAAFEAEDVAEFTQVIYEHDKIHKLDDQSTHMLLEIKKILKNPPEPENEAEEQDLQQF